MNYDIDTAPCVTTCPKCGSIDAARRHREEGEKWQAFYGSKKPNSDYAWNPAGSWIKAKKEHISHHCRCCQYEWETPTLDHK